MKFFFFQTFGPLFFVGSTKFVKWGSFKSVVFLQVISLL